MSNTKEELEKSVRYILDTRHTVPLGQSHTDTYTPRIVKFINAEVTAVLDEANNTIKELQTYLLSENSTEKLVELEDATKAIQSIKERYNDC